MNPTLSAYLAVLLRWWRVVVALPLITLTLAAVYLIVTPAQYESTAVVFVSTPRDDEAAFYRGDLYAKERLATYAALINSPDLAQRVNEDIGLGMDVGTLSAAVSLTPLPGTVLLSLTASGATPSDAQTIAAAYVEELRRSVSAIESVPGSLTPRAELVTVQPPSFSTEPGGFPAWMILGGAGGLGLVLGCFLVVLISLLDGRVRRPEDAAEATGAPVLAVFPASIPWKEPQSQAWVSEAARELRTPLDRLAILGSRTVIVASPDHAGKTGTALAVARTLADRGSSVVVVDFDSRASHLVDTLALRPGATVRTLLDEPQSVPDEASRQGRRELLRLEVADWQGVAIIPFGDSEDNPGATADSPALDQVFEGLKTRYDWLIVDTPAVNDASEAIRLARTSDAILLVAKERRTSFDALRRTAEDLTAAGGHLAGVVFVADAQRPERQSRRRPMAPESDAVTTVRSIEQ